MNEKKRHYVINIVFTILLMITIVVFMKTSATPYSQADQKEVHKRISNTKQKQNVEHLQQLDYAQDETRPEISHEEIVSLMDQFMDTLVQEVDDNYKVIHFDHIDDLVDELAAISTHEIAQIFIGYYYENKSDGLYIIPTETPPWFMADHPYDVVQLNEDQVQITQTNETDFYGTYTIELELTYQDGWKITKITHS